MNYLDELLALYPGRDWQARRYLMSHLGGVAAGLETDSLLEFLWGETASEPAPLRNIARRQLGRVLPSCLRQAHGLEAARIGVWSTWAAGARPEPAARPVAGPADPAAEARLLAAGWQHLWPLIARALELLDRGTPRVRLAASLVAGRVQTRSGIAALSRSVVAGGAVSFLHACALADMGARDAQSRLVEVLREAGPRTADLAMLLSDVPPEHALPALAGLENADDDLVLTSVALALTTDGGAGARDLLERLVGRGTGWVAAFALDALAAHPQARDVATAQRVYARERREFLKVQAVKLVGAVPGADGVDFLEQVLASASPRIKAAALEALARKQVDPAQLARSAARDVSSDLLKLQVNAMLVLARTDAAAIQAPLDGLLGSAETVARVEAAYVLGYLPSPAATDTLGELAASDPALPVRLQAIRSLSKHEAVRALPHLLAAAASSHPRIAALAARALSAGPEDALEAAADGLASAARKAGSPVLKGLLLRAFGIATSRRALAEPVPDLLQSALTGAAEPVVLGALEGVKCLGGEPLEQVVQLSTSPDARVRHRAIVAAFLQGHVAAVESAAELLASSEESRVLSGLQALLEITILMPAALAAPQFTALRAARARLAERPAVDDFSRAENPRPAPEDPLRGRERPPAAAARFEPILASATAKRPSAVVKPRATPERTAKDAPLARAEVERTTYFSGLPESVVSAADLVRTYRPLVLAAAVLLVPLVLVLSRWQVSASVGAAQRQPLAAGALRVAELKGKVERGLPGRALSPLGPGAQVAPGERVTTGPGAQLMLTDGHGDAIYLGESSGVLSMPAQAATTPAATDFVFGELSGDVLVDFKKTRGVELIFETEHLAGPSVAVRLLESANVRTLGVIAGDPLLWKPGAPARRLYAGQSVTLAPAAP